MLRRCVAVAAAIALATVAWVSPVRADDTVRLGLNSSAPTLTLGGGKDADIIDVHGHGGFGHFGGYGGYRGGYYGGYGGYRSYYGGGYGGGYGSYYPRYYGGYSSYYYPRSYGGYSSYYSYPRYYGGYGAYGSYYPSYYGSYGAYGGYYSRPSFYFGISSGNCGANIVTLPLQPNSSAQVVPSNPVPATPPATKDGTYPYDGGPDRPVPMPKVEPEGTQFPKQTVPAEGRPVSLPAKSKYVFPAYGEQPTTPKPVDTYPVKATR